MNFLIVEDILQISQVKNIFFFRKVKLCAFYSCRLHKLLSGHSDSFGPHLVEMFGILNTLLLSEKPYIIYYLNEHNLGHLGGLENFRTTLTLSARVRDHFVHKFIIGFHLSFSVPNRFKTMDYHHDFCLKARNGPLLIVSLAMKG